MFIYTLFYVVDDISFVNISTVTMILKHHLNNC